MKILEHYPLGPHNSFGFDVKARYFARINNREELQALLASPIAMEWPLLVLGEGSNILFRRDFEGLVISPSIRGIHVVRQDEEYVWVKAGAGERWDELVASCVRAGFGGVENLSWIPGHTGAAPVQNIGAYGTELCELLEAVEVIRIDTREKLHLRNAECRFGYRDSVFKSEMKDQFVITQVVLRLRRDPELRLDYYGIREMLSEMGISKPGIREVRDAVIRIRSAKLPDPAVAGNAGSFFKNPVITASLLTSLRHQFPDIPSFRTGEGLSKIPAAWLIDQCGWKGKKLGSVGVHEKQPLVLVHYGGGTGEELLSLGGQIRESVLQRFGIHLEEEVRII